MINTFALDSHIPHRNEAKYACTKQIGVGDRSIESHLRTTTARRYLNAATVRIKLSGEAQRQSREIKNRRWDKVSLGVVAS
jgi:hypothetical protein